MSTSIIGITVLLDTVAIDWGDGRSDDADINSDG